MREKHRGFFKYRDREDVGKNAFLLWFSGKNERNVSLLLSYLF